MKKDLRYLGVCFKEQKIPQKSTVANGENRHCRQKIPKEDL